MTAEEIDLITAYRKLDAARQAFVRGVILGCSRSDAVSPLKPVDDDDEDLPPHRRRR